MEENTEIKYYTLRDEAREGDTAERIRNRIGSTLRIVFHPGFYTAATDPTRIRVIDSLDIPSEYFREIPKPANSIIHFEQEGRVIIIDLDDNMYYLYSLDMYDLKPLISSQIDVPDDVEWSTEVETSTAFIEEQLNYAVGNRYSLPRDNPAHTRTPGVLDSYMPHTLITRGAYDYSCPCNGVKRFAISPLTANLFDAELIPTETLCRLLGYSKRKLNTLFTKVKDRKLTIGFVGAGGTGINTIYWLSQISDFLGMSNIFECVDIFDEDVLEFSNLLRFPIDPRVVQLHSATPFKVNLAYKLACNLSRDVDTYRHYLPSVEEFGSSGMPYGYTTGNDETRSNVVLYGAPEIGSRDALSNIGNFICATHADTSCSVHLNPTHGNDLNIQVETYGKIQLSSFFMNQLKMAITLIEILADTSIDLQAKNKSLLEYEFTLDKSLKVDQEYTWPTGDNVNVNDLREEDEPVQEDIEDTREVRVRAMPAVTPIGWAAFVDDIANDTEEGGDQNV